MKLNDQVVMRLMVEAVIELRQCLQAATEADVHEEPLCSRVAASLDRSNRILRRALYQLNDCGIT